MASSSALSIISDCPSFCTPRSSFYGCRSATIVKWGLIRDQGAQLVTRRTKGQAFRVLANPNVSPRRGDSKKEVIMVDPLEAKRLAAKQMEEIKAKEKLEVVSTKAKWFLDSGCSRHMTGNASFFSSLKTKDRGQVTFGDNKKGKVIGIGNRRRQIEAINGAWAMIGLATGLVIEGHTGNSILSQLAGYWVAIVHLFVR
ncbi:hypothetical protein U1Q18_027878 [Sarracenia purpurea var. burkii]